MSESTEYEKLVKDLLETDVFKQIDNAQNVEIVHNTTLKGASGHDHQVDVLLRLKVAGLQFIIIVECKCYSSKISVDQVLELDGRLSDTRAHKGAIVTTIGFQEGAEKVARSKRIALVKLEKQVGSGTFQGAVVLPLRLGFKEAAQGFILAFFDVSAEVRDSIVSDRPSRFFETMIESAMNAEASFASVEHKYQLIAPVLDQGAIRNREWLVDRDGFWWLVFWSDFYEATSVFEGQGYPTRGCQALLNEAGWTVEELSDDATHVLICRKGDETVKVYGTSQRDVWNEAVQAVKADLILQQSSLDKVTNDP